MDMRLNREQTIRRKSVKYINLRYSFCSIFKFLEIHLNKTGYKGYFMHHTFLMAEYVKHQDGNMMQVKVASLR